MSVHYATHDRPPRSPWLPFLPVREVLGIAALAVTYARNLTCRSPR